jgi:NAD+ synthase
MIKEIEKLINVFTHNITEFTDIAVIGLSGGADSTLVSILCAHALLPENVYGVSIPCFNTDNTVSSELAQHLRIQEFETSITNIYTEFKKCLGCTELPQNSKLLGNIQARLRMTTLYAICEGLSIKYPGKRVRVIGTDNLSPAP